MLSYLIPSRLAAAVSASLLLLAAAACGGGGPEELEISVKVDQGKLSPETIRVNHGDMVTLKIEAEETGGIHVHGYDIGKDVAAGEAVDLFFVADATGRFQITFHRGGGSHGEIFESEELQPGDAFTYQVEDQLEGSIISYHSHLRPAVAGSIRVFGDAPPADRVEVEIREAAAVPAEIDVRPGTAITWTNTSGVVQKMVSGAHADFVKALAAAKDPGAGAEQVVGFLEVRPR